MKSVRPAKVPFINAKHVDYVGPSFKLVLAELPATFTVRLRNSDDPIIHTQSGWDRLFSAGCLLASRGIGVSGVYSNPTQIYIINYRFANI